MRSLVVISEQAARLGGVLPDKLYMKTRNCEIVVVRHAAMYVAWIEGHRIPAIGRFFNRQHTSVNLAISKGRRTGLPTFHRDCLRLARRV